MWSLEGLSKKLTQQIQNEVNNGLEGMKSMDIGSIVGKAKDIQSSLAATKEVDLGIDGVKRAAKQVVTAVQESFITPPNLINQMYPRLFHLAVENPETASQFLNQKFKEKFLVVNLSERVYDKKGFEGQVIDFSFPGFPICPLESVFNILFDIDNFLRMDEENQVLVHCVASKRRSYFLLSSVISFLVLKKAKNRERASFYVKNTFKVCAEKLDVDLRIIKASQVRYQNYIETILSGNFEQFRKKIFLCRIKVKGLVKDLMTNQEKEMFGLSGIRPKVEVFNKTGLIYSSIRSRGKDKKPLVYSLTEPEKESDLVTYVVGEDFVLDNLNIPLHEDILLRFRHINSSSGKKTSLFRIVFNTNFLFNHENKLLQAVEATFNKFDLDDTSDSHKEDQLQVNIQVTVGEKDDLTFWQAIEDVLKDSIATQDKATNEQFAIDADFDKYETSSENLKGFEDFQQEIDDLVHNNSPQKNINDESSALEDSQIKDHAGEDALNEEDYEDLADLENYFLSMETNIDAASKPAQ